MADQPRKIILRIRQPAQQEQELKALPSQQTHQVEQEPLVSEVVGLVPDDKTEPTPSPNHVDDALDEAMLIYEELMNEVEHIKQFDKNLMDYCKENNVRLRVIKGLLSRLAERRNALVSKAEAVLEKLKEIRDNIGLEFAEIEEELVWASIEVNTLQLERGKVAVKNVRLKEELEARIRMLRENLTTLYNKLKTLERMIRQVSNISKNVREITSNKEEAEKLFEDVKKQYLLTHGPNAEAILRAEVERIAQQESIPREYAVLLVWKSIAK